MGSTGRTRRKRSHKPTHQKRPQSSEGREELREVHARRAQERVDLVPQRPLQPTSLHPPVLLEVSDGRLYRRPSPHPAPQTLSDRSPPPPADMDLAIPLVVVAPVAHVNVGLLGFCTGRRGDPTYGALQRVAVVGVSPQSLHCEYPPAFGAYGEGDFAPEFVAFMSLALRDALHLRGVDAVELALVLELLEVEPLGKGEQIPEPFARRIRRFALYVPDDPAEDGPEPAGASARPPPLFGMRVAALPREQGLANAHV